MSRRQLMYVGLGLAILALGVHWSARSGQASPALAGLAPSAGSERAASANETLPVVEATTQAPVSGERREALDILAVAPERAPREAPRTSAAERRPIPRPEAKERRAVLRILTDQPGLKVMLLEEGKPLSRRVGTTQESGEVVVHARANKPLRIDVLDEGDFVMGSTEVFESFHPEGEHLLRIPCTPGSLEIWLPAEQEIGERQAVQYVLESEDFGAPVQLVETVYGDSPERDLRGVKRSASHIRFARLRPGRYRVDAYLLRKGVGRWYSTGCRWRSEARVAAAGVTLCRLR